MNNNPKIQAAYANSSAVKENKVQTIANYTPSVSTSTGIMRNKPDMSGMPSGFKIPTYTKYLLGTISLSQLVYDFGVTQNQYTINKLEWENAKQNIESVVNTVVCDVKDAYYNLLYALSAKQVRQETVEQYETMYKQARAFYEIGTRPKVDVTIAAANLADAKANYIEATNAVDLAVSKLNNVMGTPFIEPYVVNTVMPYEATDITMKGAIEIANEARPDLKMAILQMKMADEYVKLAKKTYMPKLSVSADLSMGGRDHFTDTTWYSVGGYFEFPVINPVTITSQIKQAKAEMKQQQYNTKFMKKALEKGDIYKISKNLYNVFETEIKEIDKIKQEIINAGAIGSLMSGSGSAVYGIFINKEKAKKGYKILSKKYKTFYCLAYNN